MRNKEYWMTKEKNHKTQGISLMALIVTVGIVFGDIGTSPLYVMKAITKVNPHWNADYIIGAVSCVIWTLTLQTTLKYVVIALRADNKGEGGILALYSLLRFLKKRWLYLPAIVGASMLIADGVITPAVTVTSAVEGLESIDPGLSVIPIVLVIITLIFLVQPFGTGKIGRVFGPYMVGWFLMLGILGSIHISNNIQILKAFNPYYAVNLLIHHPAWFLILGAIFLCTTGAEALYSDLGHCGRRNIVYSWGFVKVMLILNYLGQGAWLIHSGNATGNAINPFYGIMPQWFTIFGVIISTGAAIIASQALLSGSFTLFSEAIHLDFWPRIRIKYPGTTKGQLYIPLINTFLWIGCIFTVLIFRSSSNMEAAYGLAITVTMLMTTLLLGVWMHNRGIAPWITVTFMIVFLLIEGTFFVSNVFKFMKGGWYTILLALVIFAVMYIWQRAVTIRAKFHEFRRLSNHKDLIESISKDKEIPKYASNLVYISRAYKDDEVESKIIYSIINKHPKRADHYWFVRIHNMDAADTLEYKETIIAEGIIYLLDIYIGYSIEPKVSTYIRQIIEDLTEKGAIDLTSTYPSLSERGIPGDFKFVVIHRLFSPSSECIGPERFIMRLYEKLSKMNEPYDKALGLDTSNIVIETVPLIINRGETRRIAHKTADIN